MVNENMHLNRDLHIQIQDGEQVPNIIKPNKSLQTHTRVKFLKTKDTE